MENKFISLLYPDEEARKYAENKTNLPDISDTVCDELGLTELFDLKNSSLSAASRNYISRNLFHQNFRHLFGCSKSIFQILLSGPACRPTEIAQIYI